MQILHGLVLLTALTLPQGALAYTAPEGWNTRPTSSSMRVAEFAVPRAQGDPEDGEVVVYYFGGGGGSVEANIQRWMGQFQQPNGQGAKEGSRATFNVGNLKVTTIDVSGTYVAEVRPGAAERHNKPNFRMRAAVVETPKGSYYVKFTGPAKTVARAAGEFEAFLRSLSYR